MNTLIHVGSRTHLEPTQILLIKAEINYSHIYLNDGKVICSSTTIGTLEKRLKSVGFFSRVHKSYLINTRVLSCYGAGEYSVKEGLTFLASRRKGKVL